MTFADLNNRREQYDTGLISMSEYWDCLKAMKAKCSMECMATDNAQSLKRWSHMEETVRQEMESLA